MTDRPPDGESRRQVPSALEARLRDLAAPQLRATAEFVQTLLDDRQPVTTVLDERDGEEILHTTDRGTYTAVVKRQDCAESCPDCPHGPYLYHVTREPATDGTESLHWSFVGRVHRSPERDGR